MITEAEFLKKNKARLESTYNKLIPEMKKRVQTILEDNFGPYVGAQDEDQRLKVSSPPYAPHIFHYRINHLLVAMFSEVNMTAEYVEEWKDDILKPPYIAKLYCEYTIYNTDYAEHEHGLIEVYSETIH